MGEDNIRDNNYRDMEERTLKFGKDVMFLCKKIKFNTVDNEIIKQLIRSGCSIGANYIEANEALSKKDRIHRIRISRKEAKETSYWLSILEESTPECREDIIKLQDETRQIRNILSSILDKISQ